MIEKIFISDEVRTALDDGRPVVALESTIITHGMPAPRNLETARVVESTVRENGAVPATIAVLQGRLIVGLSDDELCVLAASPDVLKLSSADLAHAMATGANGSTTVAATMAAAAGARIAVFATGGIGGVHRGAAESFDISADLDALARERMIVVCAGPKAILDIPLTLEALETRGVPVVALGTDMLPTFWSRDGAIPAPLVLASERDIARMFGNRGVLGQPGALLATVPVPEADAISSADVAVAIEMALERAAERGVTGKAMTPYLLQQMLDLTNGRSLETNVALILNNAAVAARVAKALASQT